MEERINIGISNRHVHITKEVFEMLFDGELEMDRPLTQPGEFASKQKLTICVGEKEIAGVRVLGPFRSYNQVEVSRKDALSLKINPPVRASGDLEGASKIILKTEKGTVELEACIIAQRHVHITPALAEKYGVIDKQKVQIKIDGERSGIIDAYIKVSDNGYFEAHVDTDDACAFLLESDAKGTMIV